jgi:NAD(P)-dependent dehydrogenase (short-subunit alcohol dehydrogenase family)
MMTDGPLTGRAAVVTGGASGMGRATVEALVRRGARVAVLDLNVDNLADGPEALAIDADVSDEKRLREAFATVAERLGGLHVLVNAAGVAHGTAIEDISPAEWDHVLDVNLRGTFFACQYALPLMRAAGWGRIVNFSSTAGKTVSTVGGAHYTASKHGVLGLTRHLASRVGADGITVNAVCPGLIDTPMARRMVDDATLDMAAAGFPIPRLGESCEVAELVAFLASDQAAYITGAAVDINGGDLLV